MDVIEAIIFDADGMVVLGERFSAEFARKFGVPEEKLTPFFENEFQKCAVGEMDLKEAIQPYLSVWGWEKSVDDLLDFWFRLYRLDIEMIDAIRMLREQGIKCVLATNMEEHRLHFLKNEMGILKLFDRVFSSSEIGFKKNDPTFLTIIADSFPEFSPEHFLFWDNKTENVAAAKSFGFQARQYIDIEDFKRTVGLPVLIPHHEESGPGKIQY